jgi:glutamate N-acetyltransferase / amino-acid N-acetyltransferase
VVPGFRFAGVAAGIKKNGKPDVAILAADGPVPTAAVFTQNRVVAAPVVVAREHVEAGKLAAIVMNSGNANACTGKQGLADARAMTRLAGAGLGVDAKRVGVASTGVIGVPLPMDRVERGIAAAAGALRPGWDDFVAAILTTDKGPKTHVATVRVGHRVVTVAGCAKGAGMIAPNMATTLSFLVTDADVTPAWLRGVTKRGVDATYNRVLVDGDTSTNDALFLMASGAAAHKPSLLPKIEGAVREVMDALARLLVADGEGAAHVAEIRVTGAPSDRGAEAVARAIATSPLVKTAMSSADPNWGRILGAAGRAGVKFDQDRVRLDFDEVPIVRRGLGVMDEPRAHAVMAKPAYTVRLDLGAGRGSWVVWTCDLGHEYVRINASYRS